MPQQQRKQSIPRYSKEPYKPNATPHTERVVVSGKKLTLRYVNGKVVVKKE